MRSDRDLLDQILRRDAGAFEELMARHRPAVLVAIQRILRDQAETQDVAQEVFLRVWTRAEQWSGDGSAAGWILRIATNLALNQLRSTGRRRWQSFPQQQVPQDDDNEQDSQPSWLADVQGMMPDQAAQRFEKHQLVRDLLADLPEDKRELLRLVFDAEMELNDVAEHLGVPLGTVKSRLHYTVKNLNKSGRNSVKNWRTHHEHNIPFTLAPRFLDAFIQDRLPRLLAQRLPLVGYSAEPSGAGTYACRLRVVLKAKPADLVLEMPQTPQPDADGAFEIADQRYVCLPLASCPELDRAQIRCVGEQLYDLIEARLGEAPRDLEWDQDMARAWLPLDAWITEFVLAQQPLDYWDAECPANANRLAALEHLRRVHVDPGDDVVAPGQLGRVCPVMTPEGTHVGRMLALARGATIKEGRIVVLDDRPEMTLSLSASLIPFLEHSDPNRLLMGANMMRQWVPPESADREPPLVQTGVEQTEPAAREAWCGRNLLTAFMSLGADTHEDAIVISHSAAQRMGMVWPLEPGDKLSNRHGAKGTISRILPDEQMPHLPDGTPVELVFCFTGLLSRLNVGQLREAVAGRIARAEGRPFIAPPFAAPTITQLRERLAKWGMDPLGMERLTRSKRGAVMPYPTTVGWVLWGKTHHMAAAKIWSGTEKGRTLTGQRHTDLDYLTLRDLGATANIAEAANLRDTNRPDAGTLVARVVAGRPLTAAPPTPVFAGLTSRLAAGGIRAQLSESEWRVQFEAPPGQVLELAQPVSHPWSPDRQLRTLGLLDLPQRPAVVDANTKLAHMLAQQAPAGMLRSAQEQLEQAVQDYFGALLTPQHLGLSNRVQFSARAVITPSSALRVDQVGLPEEIVWALFGPLVQQQVAAEAVSERTPAAVAALDAVLSQSWVVINRAPTLMPTSLLAFHPVRMPHRVIHLHPLTCMLLNADFDGDQVAVSLPLTDQAQREAGSKLSIAGHLRRDPALVRCLLPHHAALWGLAHLSLTPAGLDQIKRIAGIAVAAPGKCVTHAWLETAARAVLTAEGVDRALDMLQQWTTLGFAHAAASGASFSPFAGTSLELPPPPRVDVPALWQAYAEEIAAAIDRFDQFDDPDLGPQALAALSGARGNPSAINFFAGHIAHALSALSGARGNRGHLAQLLGARGVLPALDGKPVIIRHGWMQGLSPNEFFACAVQGRRDLRQIINEQVVRSDYGVTEPRRSGALTLLARAMRSPNPGVVLARAAVTGETDPLTDLDTRLFVGLPV